MKHYGIGETDIVPCRAQGDDDCEQVSVELHHIIYRSQGGTDEVENLIPVCRHCHELAHAKKLTVEYLQERVC